MYDIIYQRKYYQDHKEAKKKFNGIYHHEHPEVQRKTHLKARYGISLKDYEMILSRQQGVCAICGKPPKRWRLDVDHDHITGKVRGLLCRACNTKIDWFHKYFDKASNYLES